MADTQLDRKGVITKCPSCGQRNRIAFSRLESETRCGKCQTALWSTYGGRTYMRFVRVGSLDEPAAIEPDLHIFTRSKLPWVGLPANARAFEVYYDMQKEWPAQSLARAQAAREAAERS